MTTLAALRCHHHPDREASARCPRCKRTCCRECVTEHEGRVLCSACLRETVPKAAPRARLASALLTLAAALVGLAATWTFFALVGKVLVALPPDVHEGAAWHRLAEDDE